jgi:S-adenosylmethionine:tRNA ribosyltransferase-isomerase
MRLQTGDFDYSLPQELIAQTPVEPRDASRLLVLHRDSRTLEHRKFSDIGDYLQPGDLLVVNDTRVLRARLRGTLADSSGAIEVLLLTPLADGSWECLMKPARKARPGRGLVLGGTRATVLERLESGNVRLAFEGDPETGGEVPLPPYIHTPLSDGERYQTVYARERGSAAAPTAGLHFTAELIDLLLEKGVRVAAVTLHIGPGTFRPVQTDDPAQHRMHAEYGVLGEEAAEAIRETRSAGARVVCVGTTSVRLVEQAAAATESGQLVAPWQGWTDFYILPGHQFRAVDALVTNFHLPKSTLLVLVSAFAGREFVLAAYEEAIRERYRFYSFGDAMLVL